MHPCMSLQIVAIGSENLLVIEGELNRHNAADFEMRMRAQPVALGDLSLDLHGLEIADGPAVTSAINVLRALLGRAARVVVHGAPQVLGHNLYRVGLLAADGPVELLDMRNDEAYG